LAAAVVAAGAAAGFGAAGCAAGAGGLVGRGVGTVVGAGGATGWQATSNVTAAVVPSARSAWRRVTLLSLIPCIMVAPPEYRHARSTAPLAARARATDYYLPLTSFDHGRRADLAGLSASC
jgi:hypothetical protein